MALTKFTKVINYIKSLADKPNQSGGFTASQLKAKFDELGDDLKEYINDTLTVEIEEELELKESSTDLTNNRKLSPTGDFTGTLNGNPITSTEPGLSSEVANARGGFSNLRLKLDSMMVNVKDFGAHSITETGYENFDSTAVIQAAIDGPVRGGFGKIVYIPAGVFKITQTLIVPSCVLIRGAGSQQGEYNQGGTELQWHGDDGGTLMITSVDDNSDWSKGLIENIRIRNVTATTSGWGLKVRNPQNGSRLKNVHITGFPTRQCLVYEATPSPRGSSPGFFNISDNCFFIGGEVPLEIEQGVEQISVRDLGIDTGSNTQFGILISAGSWPGASVASQRWACLFDSTKIEIRQTSNVSCGGFKWNVNSPITFTNCCVQYNELKDGLGSDKYSFYYTNSSDKIPTVELVNCTSWNMAGCFKAEEAGIIIPNKGLTVATSFSYSRKGQEVLLVFARADLSANANNAGLPYSGLSGIVESAGIVMPRTGVVTAITARVNGAITAGSITIKGYKNDSALFGQNVLTNVSQQNIVNVDNYIFNAGDRIGVYANSTSDLTPFGVLDVVVGVLVKFLDS